MTSRVGYSRRSSLRYTEVARETSRRESGLRGISVLLRETGEFHQYTDVSSENPLGRVSPPTYFRGTEKVP